MKKQLLVLAALSAAALLVGTTRTAKAALELKLSANGGTPVVVTDNGTGDLDTGSGRVLFSGSVGPFAVVITAGTSNSPGANGLAILQTHTIAVRDTSNQRASLTVSLGDTGFTNPSGNNLTLSSSFAGTFLSATPGESVTFQSYADPSNTQFGTAVTTGLHTATLANGSQSPVGFSTPDRTTTFNSSGPYSLNDVTTINLSAGGQANVSGTTSVFAPAGAPVPEPASLSLAGLGAAALLLRRRRTA